MATPAPTPARSLTSLADVEALLQRLELLDVVLDVDWRTAVSSAHTLTAVETLLERWGLSDLCALESRAAPAPAPAPAPPAPPAPELVVSALLSRWGMGDGDGLCAALRVDKAQIAGSAVLHAYLTASGRDVDWEPGDLDIWSEQPLVNVENWLCGVGAGRSGRMLMDLLSGRDDHRSRTSSGRERQSIVEYTLNSRHTFQLIQVGPSVNERDSVVVCPFDPALEFDLGCCAFSFDGSVVTTPRPGTFDLVTLSMSMVRWPTTPLQVDRCLERIEKYEERGFTLLPADCARMRTLRDELTAADKVQHAAKMEAARLEFLAQPRAARISRHPCYCTVRFSFQGRCSCSHHSKCIECGGWVATRAIHQLATVATTSLLHTAQCARDFPGLFNLHPPGVTTRRGRECFVCRATVCADCADNPKLWNCPPDAVEMDAEDEAWLESNSKRRREAEGGASVSAGGAETVEHKPLRVSWFTRIGGWRLAMCRPCADLELDIGVLRRKAKLSRGWSLTDAETRAEDEWKAAEAERKEREAVAAAETHNIAGLNRVQLLLALWGATGQAMGTAGETPTEDDACAAINDGAIGGWFGRPINATLLPDVATHLSAGPHLVCFAPFNDEAQRWADTREDVAGRIIAGLRGQDASVEHWNRPLTCRHMEHAEVVRRNNPSNCSVM